VADNVTCGINVSYATNVNVTDVKITNAEYGIYTQNYGAKTFTLTNCEINATTPIRVYEKKANTDTFKLVGTNNFGTNDFNAGQYAKFVLTAKDATLVTGADDLNVVTNVEGYIANYASGAYGVVPGNVMVGNKTFASLVDAINAAQDGDVVVVLKSHTINGANLVATNNFGYDALIVVDGKNITIDFNGNTVTVTPDATNANGGIAGILEAVIFVENGATLTLKDSVGNGGFNVESDDDLYSFVYNCGSTVVFENGTYNVAATTAGGSLIYADNDHATYVKGGNFTLGNVHTAAETKPWIINTQGKNVSFVIVTGGTFNSDLLLNKDSQKDCEASIPAGYHIYSYENGVWTVEKHTLVAVDANDATCTTEGNIAHVHCDVCGKNYTDDTCETELASVATDKISHTYTPEYFEATFTADAYTVYTCVCGDTYTVVHEGTKLEAEDYYTFLGAGLKWYGATSTSAKIRFGYKFAEGLNVKSWGWNYGLNPSNMTYAEGTNIDSNNVTNLVISGISPMYYDYAIYAQLVLVVEINGVEITVVDEIQTRTVIGVANAIVNDVTESAQCIAYAQSIIDEYNKINTVACVAYGKENI
jgi:hypothetical protein